MDDIPAPQLTVYYNSACPVCNAGIESQRATMKKRDIRGSVEWVDIACNFSVVERLGVTVDQVRHSLHVVQGETLLIGADAFIALARVTPRQKWMARVFGNRYILPLSRFCYKRFADLLFWWNKRSGHW